jgi:hypothetical protein
MMLMVSDENCRGIRPLSSAKLHWLHPLSTYYTLAWTVDAALHAQF